MRVLLVEDEVGISKSIALHLAKVQGIVCDCVRHGKRAIELAVGYDYDVILLDLILPDINGYEVLMALRKSKIKTPIMILSAIHTEDQKVRCLDSGADDYMTKQPLNYGELVSRIKALHRRSKGKANSLIKLGKLVINFDDRVITVDGKEIKLTGTEYSILELLASKKGTIIKKDTFINHLYHGINERQPKIVDVFICKLREKLKKASGGEEYITTVWGRGYLLKDPEDDDTSTTHQTTDFIR
jgi:two-component system, cell cycle response regulator CtrA